MLAVVVALDDSPIFSVAGRHDEYSRTQKVNLKDWQGVTRTQPLTTANLEGDAN
jgi:hypothetical protein